MKTLLVLRAATMVLSLGIGTAYADDGDGAAAYPLLAKIPGAAVQAPVPSLHR
jgi:hypothetical protein